MKTNEGKVSAQARQLYKAGEKRARENKREQDKEAVREKGFVQFEQLPFKG